MTAAGTVTVAQRASDASPGSRLPSREAATPLKTVLIRLLIAFLPLAMPQAGSAQTSDWKLDPLSYAIGNFSTFAEIVDIGLKRMALSQALAPAEMDRLEREVRRIAEDWSVEIYREADFLVTDLFPVSATAGKHVIIIYRDGTLDEYKELKARKAELVAAGSYVGDARIAIAYALGRLLSYPDEKIERLLKK